MGWLTHPSEASWSGGGDLGGTEPSPRVLPTDSREVPYFRCVLLLVGFPLLFFSPSQGSEENESKL